MKTSAAVLAATLASASAFVAPSAFSGKAVAATKSSSNLQMSFENELGAQAPIGFWDPLGLSKKADQAKFDRWRYIEIKHGRISMLAVVGYLVQATSRLPGALTVSDTASLPFADIPNGFGALSAIPGAGVAQIFAFIGILELTFMKQVEGSFPGDMNQFGSEIWDDLDEETKLRKRGIELNNGRAAMMGILGILMHEQINNRPFVINDLLGIDYSFP